METRTVQFPFYSQRVERYYEQQQQQQKTIAHFHNIMVLQ